MCRVEGICVLNQKGVFQDQLNTRVSHLLIDCSNSSLIDHAFYCREMVHCWVCALIQCWALSIHTRDTKSGNMFLTEKQGEARREEGVREGESDQ